MPLLPQVFSPLAPASSFGPLPPTPSGALAVSLPGPVAPHVVCLRALNVLHPCATGLVSPFVRPPVLSSATPVVLPPPPGPVSRVRPPPRALRPYPAHARVCPLPPSLDGLVWFPSKRALPRPLPPGQVAIARDLHPGGGGKAFGCAPLQGLDERLLSLPPHLRCFYSVSVACRGIDWWVDVDAPLGPSSDASRLWSGLSLLLSVLDSSWSALPPDRLLLFSPSDAKFSVHLHARFPGPAFASPQHLGSCVRGFLASLPSDSPAALLDLVPFVDLSVYDSERCCRLFGCLKAGRPVSSCLRRLLPEECAAYGVPPAWAGSSLSTSAAFRLSIPCRLESSLNPPSRASPVPVRLAASERANSPWVSAGRGSLCDGALPVATFPACQRDGGPLLGGPLVRLGPVARAALDRHLSLDEEDDDLVVFPVPTLARAQASFSFTSLVEVSGRHTPHPFAPSSTVSSFPSSVSPPHIV